MEKSENEEKEFIEFNENLIGRTEPGSKTAVGALLARFAESQKPEGERICYDPYAVYFISPEMLEWITNNPSAVKARMEQNERFFPGRSNTIVARVRFFDDFVEKSIDDGIEQLVILGAGYDSRAYRIEGLKRIKTFEIDQPATQNVKLEKIKKIFGDLPDHVAYVSCDLETEDFGKKLLDMGYDCRTKTLFLMEGVLYYLPPKFVNEILYFMQRIRGRIVEFSSIIFHNL